MKPHRTLLGVGRTQITDAGLAHLAGLTNLETLSLFGTHITDAGLAHLEKLTNLKELNLSDTRVTSEGCDKLRTALPNCRLRLF
jgi:Leucine-rich repeat (LRR) protein